MASGNGLRSLALLTGAFAQIVFGALPFVQEWSETVASRSNAIPTLITPAGYAFAIWNILFLGCVLFALYHLFRQGRASLARIGWPAAAAFWGNALWEVVVPLDGFGLASVAIIGAIWISLAMLLFQAQAVTGASLADRIARAPLFALAGWVTAALYVNILVAATSMGLPWLGSGATGPAVAILALATLTAGWLSWRTGSLLYAAAFGWGLVAIRAANLSGSPSPANELIAGLALAAIGIVILGLAAGWIRRLRQR